jgi:hypothetical protein
MNTVINSRINGNGNRPIDLLESGNHKGYLDLQYKRALDYYFAGSGINKKNAKNVLDAIKDDEGLEEKQGICKCLDQLCEIQILNNEQSTSEETDEINESGNEDLSDQYDQHENEKSKYKEIWTGLKAIAGNPQAIDSITGDSFYSVLIYKEIADQVTVHIIEYQNDGVTNDEIMSLLDAGTQYISSANPSNSETRSLLKKTGEELEEAKEVVEESNKHRSSSKSSSKSSDD